MKSCMMVLCCSVVITLNSVDTVQAQSDGQKAFESYKELALGGTWICEMGDQRLEHRYEAILDGKFPRMTAKESGPSPAMLTIIGLDPKTKKCTWWQYDAKGYAGQGTSTLKSDGVWINEWNNVGPGGKRQGSGKLTRVNADTIKFEVLKQVSEGDSEESPTETTWKRKR